MVGLFEGGAKYSHEFITHILLEACLVPQVFNARRFEVDMQPFPTIARIDTECLKLEAFAAAAPGSQADAG